MQQDQPLLAGYIPAQDQQVRTLLDRGRFDEADIAFDELIAAGPNYVDEQWERATVLVHRATLAWRLIRVPLTLELAAEGWTELDVDHPRGEAAAHTISILGYLLETIGHRPSALEMLSLGVQVARQAKDSHALAHCLIRQGHALIFRASTDEASAENYAAARELFAEALELAPPGVILRALLACHASTLVVDGELDQAEYQAKQALALCEQSEDWFSSAIANLAMSDVRKQQRLWDPARTYGSRALNAAERVNDTLMLRQCSYHLAKICEEIGDPVGESVALRRTVRAGNQAMTTLREGLGQALEQRRVAVQAQRLATAAHESAVRDPLTGLTNRRGLEQRAPTLLEATVTQGRIPWLLLIDVDWFKGVNDDAGHLVGDTALQHLAQLLRRECRSDDLICRWAGDEFVILLVDAQEESKSAGPIVAERIRAAVAAHDWRVVLGRTRQPPTVSIGVAAGSASLDHLLGAADIALYRAKQAGRNRVDIETTPAEEDGPSIA